MKDVLKQLLSEKTFAMLIIACIAGMAYAAGEQQIANIAIGAVAGLAGSNLMQ